MARDRIWEEESEAATELNKYVLKNDNKNDRKKKNRHLIFAVSRAK